MSKKPRRKNLKPPGKCIFCGGGGMSREHFWPEWAGDLLPESPEGHEERLFTFTEKTKLVGEPFKRSRQGAVKTKKIKAVCETCNNEWMGKIEEAAQPILTPMIKGFTLVLTPAMQRIVSTWIALKIMVGEHTHPETAVISQAQRTAFYERREFPANLLIRIGRCGNGGWRSAYVRHSSLLSLTPEPPKNFTGRNIQTTTFGMGQLLTFAGVHAVEGFKFEDFMRFGRALFPLWPPTEDDIHWPTALTISADDAHRLAMAFDNFTKAPQVKWRDIPG